MGIRRPLRNSTVSAGAAGLLIALVALIAIGSVALVASGYFRTETDTAVVIDKERVCDSSGSDGGMDCKYLIFTDEGTFRLTDSVFAGRWSSSDVYGRIKRCHTYEIDSYGWRIPFMSSYPNIKEMRDLGADEGCEP